MYNRWFAIGSVAWLAAVVGCSGDDGGSADTACSSGQCGGCSTCLEKCVCETGDGTACSRACGPAGSGGSGATTTGGAGGISGVGGVSGSGATGGTGIAGTGGSGAISGTGGVPSACQPQADSVGCIGEQYSGEQSPLDIYIMFDQSCSMSCPAEQGGFGLCCTGGPNPRIDHVRTAVTQFLNDPESAGMGVGIGYFGYMSAGNTSCDPSDYSTPAVPIGALPGWAQPILNSLNSVQPTGETPTGAAIRGACTYAGQWKQEHPSHAVVVLLVTDGNPEAPVTSQNGGCTPSIQDAAQAATTCYESQFQLPVYVLGVGQALSNLNQIAVAGGTNQAYIVSGGDVAQQVLQALNTIRSEAAIPCDISLPTDPAQSINYQQVNVSYCDGTSQHYTFFYVASSGDCDPQQGGWFYDDPANPQTIKLCDATCNQVSAPGGRLLLSVGCNTVVPPPR